MVLGCINLLSGIGRTKASKTFLIAVQSRSQGPVGCHFSVCRGGLSMIFFVPGGGIMSTCTAQIISLGFLDILLLKEDVNVGVCIGVSIPMLFDLNFMANGSYVGNLGFFTAIYFNSLGSEYDAANVDIEINVEVEGNSD